MRNRNLWLILAGAVLLIILIIAIVRREGATSSEIRIGAVLPMTGPLAFFGGPEKAVLEMAIEEANRTGGVKGKSVRLQVEDSKASARDGVSALQRLLLEEPHAVITSLTIVSNATQPVLTSARIPQIALSVHPTLVRQSQFTIRPYYGFEEEMRVVAAHCARKGYKRIAMLWVRVPECEAAINQVLKPELQRTGGRLVVSESYNLGDSNVRSQLTKIAAAAPNVIMVADFGTMMATILKEAAALGVRGKVLSGIGLLTAPPIDPKLLEGVPVVGPAFVIQNPPRYVEFSQNFKQRAGGEATYDVLYTYDAMNLLLEGIRRGGTSSEGILQAIRSMGRYDGVSGRMTILPDGNVIVAVAIGIYKGGKLVPLQDN
jgi:branched-chain amino acid transport system substrate-binding protein